MSHARVPAALALAAALLGAASPAAAQSPAWTAIVNVRPEPSPYIADWENDPLMVTLVLSYTGSAGVVFHLEGSILRGSTPIVTGRSTTFEFVRPTQLILTTRDGIWERNSVTYQPSLRDQIERTGRIPDGDYQFCVDVRQGPPEVSGGALLARDCGPFSITAPQPPSLVSPQDGDSLRVPYPTFIWTPIVTTTNARFTYHVRIARIQPGQTPLEALGNVPQYEADQASNALPYPATALPLEDSASYVWQVQALDDAGQPLGERQGKSEAWRFVFQSRGAIAAVLDSTPPERAVARFRWGGIEVKVLSLTDSSRDNYTGVGRVRVIPGLLEPSFEFAGVHLDSAGGQVRFAPRHVIAIPNGWGVVERGLHNMRSAPFFLDLSELLLVADSGGDQFIAASGRAALHLGLGQADSVAVVPSPVSSGAVCTATSVDPALPPPAQAVLCLTARDALASADSSVRAQVRQDYEELRSRALSFRIDTLRLDGNGLRGTSRLERGWVSGVFGLGDASLELVADSTVITLSGGTGQLDMQGLFRAPSSAGLVADPAASRINGTGQMSPGDSSLVVAFHSIRMGADGDAVITADGLPRAWIGQTGMRVESGSVIVDLSATESPLGRPADWRGVVLENARLTLPGAWQSAAPVPMGAITIDGSGFSGAAFGSNSASLAAATFNGFAGAVDSVRLAFAAGALSEGYVAGRLRVEVIEADIPYGAYLTAHGVDRVYTTLDPAQHLPMPGYGGYLKIERGDVTGLSPDGVLTVDGKLSVSIQNIDAPDIPVLGMRISPDGDIHFAHSGGNGGPTGPQTEWAHFDYEAQRFMFKYFPMVPDSFGFGRGQNPDERWFGFAGQIQLNGNIPYADFVFRIIAQRDPDRHIWQLSHVDVDKIQVIYQNGAVGFRGAVSYTEADSVYGTSFSAMLNMSIKNSFSVGGRVLFGTTDGPGSFPYWFVSASLTLPPPGIQLGPLPLAIWGFKGGAYSHMRAIIDSTTLAQHYVPDSTNSFGLKAAVAIGTSANAGYAWNADLWLEAAVNTSGGLQSMSLRGDNWFLTEVPNRYKRKLWGTVLVDLPASRDLVHANLSLNAFMPPYLSGTGWAEMHYEPGNWYVNVGTPQRPDTFTLLPTSLDIPGTAYFMLDPNQVSAGFAAELEQHKDWGIFRGSIRGGFEAAAQVRYRPFQATGDGELWGDISAEVYTGGDWYELLGGSGRATLHFRFPDPTGVWGRIKLKYRLLHGTVRGTYRARYRWGDTPDPNESDADQFTIVGGTFPLSGDTAAPLTGFTFYLGMNESAQYGMDDGVYRLRLSGTPVIERRTTTPNVIGSTSTSRGGQSTTRQSNIVWQSIGSLVRDWEEERGTLVLKAPGYATLAPGTNYRVRAIFVLEKQDGSAWTTIATADSTIEFHTTGQAPLLAALITDTDPPGSASPMYFGGPDAGAIRVQFSNSHPDLTSGLVTGRLVANGTDTVAGTWGNGSYSRAVRPIVGDPTLYAFQPAGGALAPGTSYRFAVVSTDSTATEHRSVSFTTSRYATLQDHVGTSVQTVTANRGHGPLSSSGSYLLSARVALAGPEPISWDDIDSIEVVGLAGWDITPRTQCQWAGGASPQLAAPGVTRSRLCGATPTYENVLDVQFSAASDADLPPGSTSSLTIRLNHRREGWRSFTFTLPSLVASGGAGNVAAVPGASPGVGGVAGSSLAGQVTTGAAPGVAPGVSGPSGTTVPVHVPTTVQVTRIRL